MPQQEYDPPKKLAETEPAFFNLMYAASRGNWEKVDEGLTTDLAARNHETARGLLDDMNPDIRDFAATVFEKSTSAIDERTTKKLLDMVATDKHPYARYRAAFALYKRGDRSEPVMKAMEEAKGDKDVAEIAEGYLAGS